jgi:hypothetical protein
VPVLENGNIDIATPSEKPHPDGTKMRMIRGAPDCRAFQNLYFSRFFAAHRGDLLPWKPRESQ